MLYTLSRKLITGDININTPVVVLEEICESHGIGFDDEDISVEDYLDAIEDTEIYKVGLNNKHKSSSLIARFINKDCSWNMNSLKKAFNFLIKFCDEYSKEEIINLIPNDPTFGQQTMDNIYSINYCVCYKICNLFGIELYSSSTRDDLEMAIRLLKYKEESLRNYVYKMDKSQLVNSIINFSRKESENINSSHIGTNQMWINKNIGELENSNEISSESLKACYLDFNSVEKMQYYSKPTLNKSAISLCAILYKLDISKLDDPVSEFYNIKEFIFKEHDLKNKTGKNYIGNATENALKKYIPREKWFKIWYELCPDMFNLRYQFNPLFPICYYKKEFLKEYLLSEGIKTNEEKILVLYQICTKYYEECNFHTGKQPNMSTNETIDLYNVDEIENEQIICWGSKSSTMVPMTISEILKCFTVNNKYVNPINMRSSLADNCLTKLKNICTKNSAISEYKDLSDKIIYFENKKLVNDKKTITFVETFNKMNSDDKKTTIKLLNLILKMGMYMRGWKRNEKFKKIYPITKPDCELEGIEGNFVESKSIMSIDKYKKYSKSNVKISKIVESLPLCFFYSGKYEISTDNDIGKTIGARIKIVEKGEMHKNQNSCIRLSSNYFITSSYRYLVLLGEKVPFDISRMDEIS